MQVKLLRVLQEREFTRVGGEHTIQVDVRVIAATNKNLIELISKAAFREDLYYRLNVVGIEIPTLRQRREDVPLLAQHFLDIFSAKNHKEIKGFTPQAMDYLIKYDWPGNVRELMNAVERAVVLTRSDYLNEADFRFIQSSLSNEEELSRQTAQISLAENISVSLEDVERTTILNTLKAAGGNKSETARRLGITRKTLHKKLKAYGVMP
jgi:two-component system response regulator HydG